MTTQFNDNMMLDNGTLFHVANFINLSKTLNDMGKK